MRALVCGGRNYNDRDHVFNTLTDLDARHRFTCVIHGAATGADHEAMLWTQMMADAGRDIKHAPFVALWDDLSHPDAIILTHRNGKRYDALAGSRRNARMLDDGKPDLVIAFPGGKGTADMIGKARAAKIRVVEVAPRKDSNG